MKKIIFSSLISCVFLLISCSKSDDNKVDEEDLVFTAPYIPLENFGDLKTNRGWYYQGAKIGNKNYGAISKNNCLSRNVLFFIGNEMNHRDSIVFESFQNKNINNTDCSLDFKRTMRKVKMISKGYMYVDIFDYTVKPVDTIKETNEIIYDTIKKNYFKGNIEIGFQKDMLRVEDKFTRYSGQEKVYLYFDKIQ